MRFRALALLFAAAAVCLVLCSCQDHSETEGTVLTYQKGETPERNPYKGFAAWANDDSKRNMSFSMVYVDIYWNLLEPSEGRFDFRALEEENHFDIWKKGGKKAIFRVVLDCPGDEEHMNIPKWLYTKTGDGKFYDVSYGKGYCPDYSNAVLIQAHRRMLEALAERYGKDDFLAFIELGSLGHWGEWHIHDEIGLELAPEVYEQYIRQYLEIFPEKKMLTRRPFQMAAENGMGLFNDSFAREGETERFVKWINEGGDYKHYADALTPAPDAWKKAPVGGEISSSIDRFAVLDQETESLKETFKALHVTFVGPTNWLGKTLSEEQLARERQLSDAMGYDFYVRSLTIRDDGAERKCLAELYNDGYAPLYYPFDIVIKYRSGERSTKQTMDADITKLLPEESLMLEFSVPNDAESLWIEVKRGDNDGIYLSNDTERSGYWQKLF